MRGVVKWYDARMGCVRREFDSLLPDKKLQYFNKSVEWEFSLREEFRFVQNSPFPEIKLLNKLW